MKRKLLLVVSMLAILMCLLAISVSAANKVGTATVDGFKYTLYDDATASFQDNRNCTVANVVIPAKFTYNDVEYTVTATENYALHSSSAITSIYFPPTITKIGNQTFSSCANLKSVYIDLENLVSIGECGLTDNTSGGDCKVTNWDIYFYPTSEYGKETPVANLNPVFTNLVTLGTGSLQGVNIKDVTLGEKLTVIGVQSFRKSTIESITALGDVTLIGNWSFAQCSSLKRVVIMSNNLTKVDACAFSACENISSIKIDLSKCTYIGSAAFELSLDCQGGYTNTTTTWCNLNDENIVDLSSVETLGSEAFGTSNIGSAKIVWPKGLKSLSDQVFRKANINQPMYFQAAEGSTISISYYVLDGNTPNLVILGDRVASYNCELSNVYTLVMLNSNIKITRSSMFKASGSTLYYAGFSADSTYTSFDRCTMNQISTGTAVNYGACGIDCNVTLTSDSSNVVISTPVHTWDEGVVNEAYCPIGAVIDFGCTYCDAEKTEGEGTEHSHTVAVIVYESGFFNVGLKTLKCANDECTSVLSEGTEVKPIFTALGYSKSEVGAKSVMQGFAIDQDVLQEYNASTEDKIVGYGVMAASKIALNDEVEVFENGALKNVKVAQVDFSNRSYDVMEIKISGLEGRDDVNGDYVALELYCCGYYLVKNGEVIDSYYASEDTVTDTLVETITYNNITTIK
ncbi:MAG: leucine-rich repeat domain-containing protein [Clostridia bacterium]|nr:leucine-rich repeat domain-containing protein [Clostridia bacterium]